MSEPLPHLLLAAPPGARGLDALLARPPGAVRRVLLAGAGLAWADADTLRALPPAEARAVCSQDARAAGWTLATAPAGVRWTSVATWLAELPADAPLWVALP